MRSRIRCIRILRRPSGVALSAKPSTRTAAPSPACSRLRMHAQGAARPLLPLPHRPHTVSDLPPRAWCYRAATKRPEGNPEFLAARIRRTYGVYRGVTDGSRIRTSEPQSADTCFWALLRVAKSAYLSQFLARGCAPLLRVAPWVVSAVVSIRSGIGSESVHCAMHFQEGQLKRQEGNPRTSNVRLEPQSPPSSPKSPGCRSRSGPAGPVVASPASSCSSSQRWTRARTRALVGTPLRRLWRRRRAWTPSSRRTEIDFRKGPICARNPTRADLHPPPTARARGGGPTLAPAASLPSGCEGSNTSTRQP